MALDAQLVRILADMVERALDRASGDCHRDAVESEPAENREEVAI